MPSYDDQQSRFSRAFAWHRTLCVTDCCCGRVHFVSAPGHGDYEDGELEKLQASAASNPETYVEESEYDHIDTAYIDGRQIVPDCPCKEYKKYCDWIDLHAEHLAAYLALYFKSKAENAKHELKVAEQLGASLGPAATEGT